MDNNSIPFAPIPYCRMSIDRSAGGQGAWGATKTVCMSIIVVKKSNRAHETNSWRKCERISRFFAFVFIIFLCVHASFENFPPVIIASFQIPFSFSPSSDPSSSRADPSFSFFSARVLNHDALSLFLPSFIISILWTWLLRVIAYVYLNLPNSYFRSSGERDSARRRKTRASISENGERESEREREWDLNSFPREVREIEKKTPTRSLLTLLLPLIHPWRFRAFHGALIIILCSRVTVLDRFASHQCRGVAISPTVSRSLHLVFFFSPSFV